jgi:hypothetical protein
MSHVQQIRFTASIGRLTVIFGTHYKLKDIDFVNRKMKEPIAKIGPEFSTVVLQNAYITAISIPTRNGRIKMAQTGPPRLLRKIKFMEGDWDVAMDVKPDPKGDWINTEGTSTFRFILDNAVLEQVYDGMMHGASFKGKGFFAFNRFSGKWQHIWSDNGAANISVFEGDFVEGVLVVSGEEKTPDGTIGSRAKTFNITDARFEWILEMSFDDETWIPVMKAVYTRKKG